MFKGFSSVAALLRVNVFLRSIAKELKRANDLTEARMGLEFPAWSRAGGLERKSKSQRVEVSYASVEGWNKRHRDLHPKNDEDENDDLVQYSSGDL